MKPSTVGVYLAGTPISIGERTFCVLDIDDLVFAAAVRDYAKKNGLISNIKKIVKKK